MTLEEYFATCRRCQYGIKDCCLFPADWILARTGFDPAADVRGRYNSEATALKFILAGGGIFRLIDRHCRAAGLKRTTDPVDGDIGCVKVDGVAVGSIMKNGLWWVMAPAGKFPVRDAKLMMAWTF